MKNINRDYLVRVKAKTAKISAPTSMKFFMTDVLTSNIFFLLEFDDVNYDSKDKTISSLISEYAPKQNADYYTLTLRVVKPNNEPKTIEAKRLDKDTNFFIADLTADFVDIPGIYKCELFVDTKIFGEDDVLYIERSTSDNFEYEVKKSIFYNLDDIIDEEYISIEDIATKEYVKGLVTGNINLAGYATQKQLAYKADRNHTHNEYATKTQLDEAIASVDCSHINLVDFVVSNSISINRSENSVIGEYSTAEGDNTAATGHASHAEGYSTIATGDFSHAEGNRTKAKNYSSHAEGAFTASNHEAAHAEGYYTEANGAYSHSEGYHTIANGRYQHVQGKYNISDKTDYAHIVGNGVDAENLSNAHTLDWDGNAWFAGKVCIGEENKELVTKDYIDDEVLSVVEDRINDAISNGDIQIECDYEYDDTEIRNSITELGNNLANSLASKANKKIAAPLYEGVESLDISTLELHDENRRYIRVVNPNGLLSVELPNSIDADFAEIHAIIIPINNGTKISISIDKNPEHESLKYQDKNLIPFFLEQDIVYEFIFTYINCDNGSCRWLVGAIVYE